MPRLSLPVLIIIVGLLSVYAWYTSPFASIRYRITPSSGDASTLWLPRDLESRVLGQFDKLVSNGEIKFQPSEPEVLDQGGFQWEFRIVPPLANRPPPETTNPNQPPESGPFIDPPPSLIISPVGLHHRLLLSPYPIYRPTLFLPTTSFFPADDLTQTDLTAVWAVLKMYEHPLLAVYNSGPRAGGENPHKHLELFPLPDDGDARLWPSRAHSTQVIASAIPGVPFAHYVLRLPNPCTDESVYAAYTRLLAEAKSALAEYNAGTDNNVILTSEWIAVVPRRTAHGGEGGSGKGMLGLVSTVDGRGREEWSSGGYTKVLTEMGVPVGEER